MPPTAHHTQIHVFFVIYIIRNEKEAKKRERLSEVRDNLIIHSVTYMYAITLTSHMKIFFFIFLIAHQFFFIISACS